MKDTEGETVVLSYEAAAERLGITRASVKVRAIRAGWRRTLGNDGRALVHVPVEVLGKQSPPKTKLPAPSPDLAAVQMGHVAEIERMTEAHAAEMARITQAHGQEVTRLVQQQQDAAKNHAGEVERLAAMHRAETERLERLLADAQRPWWSRLFGGGQ